MQHAASRRSVLGAGLGLIGAQLFPIDAAWGQVGAGDTAYTQDFDKLWRTLSQTYCFFAEKQTDWEAVRRLYRPQAQAAASTADFAKVISQVLNELYDAHTDVKDRPADGPRGAYFDLWQR